MQTTTKRTTVDIDTRRSVFITARGRSKVDVVKTPHEVFIRNLLKSKLGWAKNEAAPEHIKAIARAMAATLKEQELAASKAIIAKNQAT